MRPRHAFGDDALGDLDAVGLVDALRSGEVSAPELVEAAIARTEAVNPTLNGLAYEAFDRARKRATAPRPVRRLLRRRPDLLQGQRRRRRHADDAGHRCVGTAAVRADGEFARVFLATGLVPLGKTQMSEFGFSASAEHPRIGPVRNPWNPDYTAGASSSGAGAFVAAGVVPIAHANDGGGSIRIPAACNGLGRAQADARPAAAGRAGRPDAAAPRRQWRADALRARHRGVPPRGRTGLPQPEAAADRRCHATPGQQRLRIAVCTKSVLREASPEVRELTLKTAGTARRTSGTGSPRSTTRYRPGSRTTSCSTGSSWPSRSCAAVAG